METGWKSFKKRLQQKGLAADAKAADHLALVAHADLAQLDAGVEDAGQILDQLAEVHAAVGGEVEHDLGAVEGILGLHQLHFQAVAGNALLTGAVGALFVLTVLAHPADIHAVGHAGDGLEGLGHGRIGDLLTPCTTSPHSMPRAVSTITYSPVLMSAPAGQNNSFLPFSLKRTEMTFFHSVPRFYRSNL